MEALKHVFDDLDPLLQEKGRLAIAAALAASESLTFGDLKTELDFTDGNLSVHLQKLEAAGYVKIDKSFVGRRPRTTVSLTRPGKKAFERHLDKLEAIVNRARKGGVKVS